ncbi:hypothetical protein D9M69_624180 [compost metagenome]
MQIMPARDQTGTPRHLTSSTTSGSAWRISVRTLARILPRQSASEAIFASIRLAAGSALLSGAVPGTVFFMADIFFPARLPYCAGSAMQLASEAINWVRSAWYCASVAKSRGSAGWFSM